MISTSEKKMNVLLNIIISRRKNPDGKSGINHDIHFSHTNYVGQGAMLACQSVNPPLVPH